MCTHTNALQWRHNERDCVLNLRHLDCLHSRLFRRRSKLRVIDLCEGNSPVTGEFPAQRASNAENISIWWRHHVQDNVQIAKLLHIGSLWLKQVGRRSWTKFMGWAGDDEATIDKMVGLYMPAGPSSASRMFCPLSSIVKCTCINGFRWKFGIDRTWYRDQLVNLWICSLWLQDFAFSCFGYVLSCLSRLFNAHKTDVTEGGALWAFLGYF